MVASTSLLLDHNLRFLRQAANLLAAIPDNAYTLARPPVFRSGIGAHLRHCLDHYQSFLTGLASGRIDYDARERDRSTEQSREAAATVITSIIARLDALSPADLARPVQSKVDCGGDNLDAMWTDSTAPRELQFLISHTVHHYALIGMILRLQELDAPADFGIAPSTLRHEGALPSCAR